MVGAQAFRQAVDAAVERARQRRVVPDGARQLPEREGGRSRVDVAGMAGDLDDQRGIVRPEDLGEHAGADRSGQRALHLAPPDEALIGAHGPGTSDERGVRQLRQIRALAAQCVG